MATTKADDTHHARRAGSTSAVWGYVIVLGASTSFLVSMYTMFVAKFPALVFKHDASQSSSGLLDAMENDTYYCYLVPLTIPVSILAFYANWVSLKFFRHN